MNKKILILTTVAILTLLIPSMIAISPVKAKATKFPFPPASGDATLAVDSGKVWIAGDIFHMTGSYWTAVVSGDLGAGDYEQWSHLSINLKTGKGTMQASSLTTFLDFPFEGSTLEGSSRSKITAATLVGDIVKTLTYTTTGTFVGHGSGLFEGWVQKGTSEGTATIILGATVKGSAEWIASGIFLIPPPFGVPPSPT